MECEGDVIGLDGVSAQTLSDTIGAIYDCALDPQLWAATCRRIGDLCKSTAGGICVHDMRHVQNDQLFVFGYEPEFLEKLGKNYAQTPMAAADIRLRSAKSFVVISGQVSTQFTMTIRN